MADAGGLRRPSALASIRRMVGNRGGRNKQYKFNDNEQSTFHAENPMFSVGEQQQHSNQRPHLQTETSTASFAVRPSRGETHTSSVGHQDEEQVLSYLPRHGISLNALQILGDLVNESKRIPCQRERCEHQKERCKIWTCEAVSSLIVSDLISNAEEESFCQYVKSLAGNTESKDPRNSNCSSVSSPGVQDIAMDQFSNFDVDDATVYVIHRRSGSFKRLVSRLEEFVTASSLDSSKTFFWIDVFSLPQKQQQDQTSKQHDWSLLPGALFHLLDVIDTVACVYNTWNTPKLLTRTWCVWELIGAMMCNTQVHALLSKSEKESFLKALGDITTFEKVTTTNVEDSRTSIEDEKSKLITILETEVEGGLNVVQHAALQPLRNWCVACIEEELQVITSVTERVMLMKHLVTLHKIDGNCELALPWSKEIMQLQQENFEQQTHPEVIQGMKDVVEVMTACEMFEEAHGVQKQVVLCCKEAQHSDKSAESILDALCKLATLCEYLGRTQEQVALLKEALEYAKSSIGTCNKTTINIMNELGLLTSSKQDPEFAESLFESVVENSVSLYGFDHPDTLTAKNNLAIHWVEQGKLKEAEELFLTVMETTQRVLGESHHIVLSIMNNLAAMYDTQGRHDEAERLYLNVLYLRQSLLGHEHPQTMDVMSNLASHYTQFGHPEEAEKLYTNALHAIRGTYGSHHPNVVAMLDAVASFYYQVDRRNDAEAIYREAWITSKDGLGQNHPTTLDILFNLSTLLISVQKLDEALQLATLHLQLCSETFGHDHPETIAANENVHNITVLSGGCM